MVLDGKSSQKYPVNAGSQSWSYKFATICLMTFLMMLCCCNITIYAGDTSLYPKCDVASDLWQ